MVKGKRHCARCGCDMMGWNGFMEVYDPSTQHLESYYLCPDCQVYVAREVAKMMMEVRK